MTATRNSVQVASFDVFDTVLTRAVGSPEGVFMLLGRRLFQASLIPCLPETFARARIEAERRAYSNAGRERTLQHIYAELGTALQMTDVACQQLLNQEYRLEAELIRVVPGARDRIWQRRALGQRVVFVSDMYLPAEFIRQQLIRHDLWAEGDRCFVSCDHGKSKQSGELFAELIQQTGVVPDQIIHYGNSTEHDILPPKRLGLRVQPLLDANPNQYEAQLETHTWATEGLASAMAGASRLARLSVFVASPKEAMLRDVAAGVAAPTLAGYVLWVLHRAQQLGLKRLYFLSRDGQILLDIARRMARKLDVHCELRYLYGSRLSWNLPAITNMSDEQLSWIWDTTDILSVRGLLARVAVAPEEIRDALCALGYTERDWSRSLSADERRSLRQIIQDPAAQALILQRAAQKRQVLRTYFEQEGVLEAEAWGLVDLGWYGSMQNALARIVAEAGGTQPIGFYFALWRGSIVDSCPANREAYFFDQRLGLGYIDAVPDSIALLEMFCAADHGTVVDFQDQGHVEPVLKEEHNQRVLDWGLRLVHHTISCFVDNLVVSSSLVDPGVDIRGAIADVLHTFWVNPSVAAASAWADFPWEDGLGAEAYINRLAEPYHWNAVFRAGSTGRIQPHHRASWTAGSIALTPPTIQFALVSAARIGRKLRRLRSGFRRRLGFI